MEIKIFYNKKIQRISLNLTFILVSSLWIYLEKAAVFPLGFLAVLLVFIIRKNVSKENIISAIIGVLLLLLEVGPYVSIQHPIYKIGFRLSGEIETETEEVLKTIVSITDINEKIKLLEDTLEIEDQNIEIYNLLGWNLLKLESFDEAVKYFRKGLTIENNELLSANLIIANELKNKNPEYYQYFGSLLLIQEKDYQNAIKFLLKSISINEINDEEMLNTIFYNLGVCYYSIDDFPSAKLFIEKAIAIKPDDEKNKQLAESLYE